ncbi:O-methyltransferase [Solitalea canadensis]|uniref:Putative O-methyltransferase n=1 Tax=Solitalea canadensis (strain ATCC 29591 / DSM 3403 / JCM 21819 / LMG 8368 / NBRC 15130 / NCIMB 12057 / USAM 9D) TaxID=929556 RepID=H8KX55_SOLCM|nr:class I SAM-dependent methyltransferase [Solitalea canadensis]AFD08384.1 putative O-methyltransferase [Solitalea canadensis DSM 3403]
MFNSKLLTAYITHQLTAKTRHGTHSPFVYNLVDEIIYNRSPRIVYNEIENQRQKLLSDNRVITLTDLGAGSHYNNNKQKLVKTIAANALKAPKWAQLIHRLAEWRKPTSIIELGTCLGVTTSYLAKAVPNASVTSIEGCPETAAVARESINATNNSNVKVLVGNFDVVLPELVEGKEKLDFVYFDGNHRKEATLNYFELCLKKADEHSVFIFDDIHWSEGMEEAWKIIQNHPKVTVTIDLFAIGLVFFKEGQRKEHFKIKY